MSAGDRCTGHCCRRFTVPLSASELERAREAMARQEWIFPGDDGNPRGPYIDHETLIGMLVHLEVSDRNIDGTTAPNPVDWYTCRHLQPSGDCGIYDARPGMCRNFPYRGDPCGFPGCTWSAGRDPRLRVVMVDDVEELAREAPGPE